MSQENPPPTPPRPPLARGAIECAGHPRDMGFAQGVSFREAIRGAVARAGLSTRRSRIPSLRGLASGRLRGAGAGRELIRHFAHQAERLEGLARAADLPLDGPLALQLESQGELEDAWIVRASRPVVGFRSLELTRPWLVPAVAGVNAAGLVVAARFPNAAVSVGTLAPPILLVQDCLARFEDLAGAIDWCRKRPVEGELVLWLADASGARASVVVAGRTRKLEPGLVDVEAAFGLALPRRARAADASAFSRLVVDLAGDSAGCADADALARRAGADVLRLDAIGRRLRFEPAAHRGEQVVDLALEPHVEASGASGEVR